jgi:hypothetical protein
MVEVFKTNVAEVSHADAIVEILQQYFPGNRINFDLEDCDKVLRIEGKNFAAVKVMRVVHEHGFVCEELE